MNNEDKLNKVNRDGEGRILLVSTLAKAMEIQMFESGFERFWKAYPSTPRKGAKKQCEEKWAKFLCEHSADQIIKHVVWMKTTEQWLKGNGAFIPAPLVYLNQQRWDGAEVPDMSTKTEVDPYLLQLEKDRQRAVPMPAEMRAKFAALKGQQ